MSNYKNPFSVYNTNGMPPEQISELFAEPFDLFNIKASDIQDEKSSIIFVGGRGTGKTMILRQFSYNVQKVSLLDASTFLNKVKNDKYIGIYFRVDNPLLRSLDNIALYSNKPDFAESIFTHYFELTVFKDYLEIIKIFLLDKAFKKESEIYNNIIETLKKLIDCSETSSIFDIDKLLEFVVNQINYIWKYQSEKAIDIDENVVFSPSCGMMLQGRLTNNFLKTSIMEIFNLLDVNILLLIDEFENFSEIQQKVINTAMRFNNNYGVSFRIGMRPNGFKTYDTLDKIDFIKEGRDYRKIEIGFSSIRKGAELYMDLVKKVSNKRLALYPRFYGRSIEDFLEKSENLEMEAKEIVKNRTTHFDVYIKLINKQNGTIFTFDNLHCLRHENPLFEMENLRLLLSGKSLEYVNRAFNDYLKNNDSEECKKYSNDYDKKYKLSFIFILCSIYHIEKKKYYSFTDYCQMSSGIVGCFLELCRKAFDIAFFKEREALFNGHISANIQTDAAYEYAQAEREQIRRIAIYGGQLNTFIDNIGNSFSYIHKDLYMRYPETNLFPVILDSLTDDNRKIIETACVWSLLIKKPNAQDTNAKGKKQDVYFLNRILAPSYKISYRTRGGLNPILVNDSYFETSFNPLNILKIKSKKGTKNKDKKQMELFSLIGEENAMYDNTVSLINNDKQEK